ncbi:MAG: hypothetical protein M1828_004224 [Chrysothrix sp. TS-e1954]|nr:MAG: hypothetical protein M1828_004224 [Chrysothrix sp. TS-e1954]
MPVSPSDAHVSRLEPKASRHRRNADIWMRKEEAIKFLQLRRSLSRLMWKCPLLNMIVQLCAVLIARKAFAAPAIDLPINSQVPPIAVASQPFQYQFSPATFSDPAGDALEYSIQNGPSWLSLENDSRTLLGTPSVDDLGPATFQVNAAGTDGSIQDQVTLIVAQSQETRLGTSVTPQLARAGSLINPTSVALHEGTPFNFSITKDVFVGPASTYYAVSANRSPLPSWLSFNPQTVEFSGNTPASQEGSQVFSITLIASTIAGFGGASITFDLVVGAHVLAFEPMQQQLTIGKESRAKLSSLLSQLMLDGKPIQAQNIASATAQVPSWMSFDPKTLELAGTPPAGTVSAIATVQVYDTFDDSAQTIVSFDCQSRFFTREIGVLNATIGQPFVFSFANALDLRNKPRVEVAFTGSSSWLHFNQANLVLSGQVPSSATPGTVVGNISVSSGIPALSESQVFRISVGHTTLSSLTTLATRGPSATVVTPVATAKDGATGVSRPTRISSGQLAAAIVVPAICIVAFLLLLAYCSRARNRSWRLWPRQRRVSKDDISAPISGSTMKNQQRFEGEGLPVVLGNEDSGVTMIENIEKPTDDRNGAHNVGIIAGPSKQRSHRNSIHSVLDEDEEEILQSQNRSSMGSGDMITQKPFRSRTYATDAAIRSTLKSSSSQARKRESRSSQRILGLPIDRTSMGMGHGRIGRSSMGSSSWGLENFQRRSLRFSSGKSGSLSDTASEQTCPPRNVQSQRKEPPYNERIQEFVKQRAKSNTSGPFFAAPKSRDSSASHKPPIFGPSDANNRTRTPSKAASRAWIPASPIQEGYPRVVSPSIVSSNGAQQDDLWETASSNYTSTQDLSGFTDSQNNLRGRESENAWLKVRNGRRFSEDVDGGEFGAGELFQPKRHSISHIIRSPLSELGSRATSARRSVLSESQVRAGTDEGSSDFGSGPAFI